MSKPKVFVTRKIPDEGLKMLRKECEITINPDDRVLEKHEIIEGVKGKDALLCLLTDPIDAEIMDAAPGLRVISNYAVGFNNINVPDATARHLPVTNTPGVLTESVADHAVLLMMATARRLVEADKFVRAGKYHGWAPMMYLGQDFNGKTLGILGLGRIGKAVAKRAKGFDMDVIYYDVFRNKEFEKEYGAKFGTVEDVLKKADFVTVHVPLLPTTKHLISVKQLNMMKRTAILVNTSRGPVVDEKALVSALKHKVIAGAGLDVLENEPELAPGLKELDNVVIGPHIASATIETRGAMSSLAAENLLAVLHGKPPKTQVNPEIEVGHGYQHPFYMSHGKAVKSAAELASVLEHSSDHDYGHHVTHDRNDFAKWVKDVLKDAKLATALKGAKNKGDAVSILKKATKKPEKKSPAKKK